MSAPRERDAGMLRRLAELLVRGEDAPYVLADLDEALQRDLARGIAPWRARVRHAANLLLSAAHLAWSRALARVAASWVDVRIAPTEALKAEG